MALPISPGTYLRLRREAAGVSIETLALATDTVPFRVSARNRAELIGLMEQDLLVIDADMVSGLVELFAFDRQILVQLIAIYAGAHLDPPALCRICACSWSAACFDPVSGRSCSWSADDATVCTSASCQGRLAAERQAA